MYESFYGLRKNPFSLLPDPNFLYMGKKHSSAYSMLEYGLVNQAGFTVITGEIGCGKTTLIRHHLDQMGQDMTVGLVSNTLMTSDELLQWVLLAFDLDYRGKSKVECFDLFSDFLIDEYAKNRRTVLIVDEAQNLDARTLEELRMLSNINSDSNQVLQLVLVGQPELKHTLHRPDMHQFAQRVAVDYHLEALGREETREYIHHRLSVAGGNRELFKSEACYLIYRSTQGIPRLINILCDTALVYGYAENKKVIDAKLLMAVLKDQSARIKDDKLLKVTRDPAREKVVAMKDALSSKTAVVPKRVAVSAKTVIPEKKEAPMMQGFSCLDVPW